MIYLDHNATTVVLPDVNETMQPYFLKDWGNPSSSYRFGSKLKVDIERAREQISNLIGANPRELIFTSCATESNNTAIHSALQVNPNKKHIIISTVEHSSVLNYCKILEHFGYRITYLPVDYEGILNINDLENALSEDTAVVSLMWANNETGVLFPVSEIAQLCRSRGVPFHSDGVQAIGKIPVNVQQIPVDYLSIAGHKIHAPKGIGALYINRKSPFSPFLYGGHQERNRRGGTENVPFIVGLGKAAELAARHVADFETHVRPLRDKLENGIIDSIPNAELNGHKQQRLANTSNITFHGIESEAFLLLLDQEGICASSGSACLADSEEISHVIKSMKPETTPSRQMIRFSLGLKNTETEIIKTLEVIKKLYYVLKE